MTDVTADLEPVFAGNHDVENKKRRTLALGVGKDVRSSGIDSDDEALVFEVMANEARNIRVVFDDEDRWFHDLILTKRIAGT